MGNKARVAEAIQDLSDVHPDDLYNLANNLRRVSKKALISALYESAFAQGVKEAALNYGAFLEGYEDFEAAIDWCIKAFETGDARAAILVAQVHRDRGNLADSLEWYRRGRAVPEGAVGHSQVAAELGLDHEAVTVLTENRHTNPEAAAELVTAWDALSAEESVSLLTAHWEAREHNPEAFVVSVPLANSLCENGQAEQGMDIYREAALRGDAHAAFNLGIEIMDSSETEAVNWIRLAKKLGDKKAKNWLKEQRLSYT